MRTVTPRAIAYVAVQVSTKYIIDKMTDTKSLPVELRFALSSATSWNEDDGYFSYPVFYNTILDFFENTPGPTAQAHVKALLNWWTLYVIRVYEQDDSKSKLTITSIAKCLEVIGFH
jgi:hypothetical protein